MGDSRGFVASIEASLAGAETRAHRTAVLLVGIDGPRRLQGWLEPAAIETLGHRAGCRISSCVQEEDGGTVVLLRADAFGVVLPRLRSGLQARAAANRILATLAGPFGPRIGIAIAPCDGRHALVLVRCAATALARARQGDRPTYRFYLRAFATSAASSSPLL